MGTATAYNSGAISHKAYNATLAKTKAQNAKMCDFDEKTGRRDQGGIRDRGEVPNNEIQHPTNQRKMKPLGNKLGPPVQMKGGKDRGGQPTRGHIDREQGPKFSPGGNMHSKASAGKNTRMKAKVIGAGGRYGDGNSRSNSTY